jgi:hypothetical protein
LITPLQCIDCHPLLGGVVDLGQLSDSAAPSLLVYGIEKPNLFSFIF